MQNSLQPVLLNEERGSGRGGRETRDFGVGVDRPSPSNVESPACSALLLALDDIEARNEIAAGW
jgi:hypothetical protein